METLAVTLTMNPWHHGRLSSYNQLYMLEKNLNDFVSALFLIG